jgi:hypothetical protein
LQRLGSILLQEVILMGTTTFSGPVVSQAGFITGTSVVGTSVTASTLTVDSTYNGSITPINRAAGTAITLPASSGSQAEYTFLIGTTVTSNSTTVKVVNATDVMNGVANVGGTTGAVYSTLPASDTITLNGSTTGGVAGSIITVKDVATGFWQVTANLIGSGTPATPFSATVS